MKLRALLLAGLCFASGQPYASWLSDDEVIQKLEARASRLEEANKLQAEINKQQAEANRQQTRSLLDLQTQIETQNTELRRLHGLNEELAHSLQDAEKRQKDFYIDLDTRLRHFEAAEAAALAAPSPPPPEKLADVPSTGDPAVENRAYEAAYKLSKTDKHLDAISAFQEFLKKFPASVHVPNAHFAMGSVYFALKDYKNALANYQLLAGKYSFSPKTPDAMLSIADCQQRLNDTTAAKKTLKQITVKYPDSETADEAKKRLANIK